MERKPTTYRMLKYAAKPKELSCIIGNVFAEINPPCGKCKEENIVICGTTPTGEVATLVIVKDGFLFDGDPKLIAAIRERRCIYGGE